MPAPSSPPLTITPLAASEAVLAALGALLVETVAAGGSVGFMHPLEPGAARDFWAHALPRRRVASGWCTAPGATERCWAR